MGMIPDSPTIERFTEESQTQLNTIGNMRDPLQNIINTPGNYSNQFVEIKAKTCEMKCWKRFGPENARSTNIDF